MKIQNSALVYVLLLVPTLAAADMVKIETNTWSDSCPLVWCGTLVSIDPSSNLAHFQYKNKDEICTFDVHVTRIYSLTLDDQDRVNRPFPKTRQQLTTELPSNPRSRRTLELSNKRPVTDDMPDVVRVRPDRSSVIIYLNGNIVSADLQQMMLEVRAANKDQISFEIERMDLMKWIR